MNWLVANKDLLLILIPIAGLYFTYRLGLRAYFKQREYEIVRTRYLERTLDLLSSEVESALLTFRTNWHYSLQVLKQFREATLTIEQQEIKKGFVRHASGAFSIVAAYRLSGLIRDDQVFWKMEQLLFAFVDDANDFFHNDLAAGITKGILGELNRPKKEVVDLYMARLEKYDQESHDYYPLLTELETLSGFLERERFIFSRIHQRFHKKKEVKDSISRLNAALQKVLEEDKKGLANNGIRRTGDPHVASPASVLNIGLIIAFIVWVVSKVRGGQRKNFLEQTLGGNSSIRADAGIRTPQE